MFAHLFRGTTYIYKKPDDIIHLSEDDIYALDPNSIDPNILNRVNRGDQDVLDTPKQKAILLMIRIQKEEKNDPREIGNRQRKISEYRQREALKEATQKREEQNSISRRIRRGDQQVDLLLLNTKHNVVLPELREKARKLQEELELTDKLIASSKRLGLTTQMPDEPEKRAELAKLLQKIKDIEDTPVSGGKRRKRKTFRRTKSKKILKRHTRTKV
jgi:hypothetical protein